MWATRTAWPISRLPGRRARLRARRRHRSGCVSHPRCCPGRGRPSPPPTTRRLRRAASTSPTPVLPRYDARAVTTPWPHRAPPSVNTTLRKRQAPRPGRTGTPGGVPPGAAMPYGPLCGRRAHHRGRRDDPDRAGPGVDRSQPLDDDFPDGDGRAAEPGRAPARRRAAGPRPAGPGRRVAAGHDPVGQRRAGDRGQCPGRRRRDRRPAGRRGRRLPGQAVRGRPARRADPGSAAQGGAGRGDGSGRRRWPGDRRPLSHRHAGRRHARPQPQGVRPAVLPGRAVRRGDQQARAALGGLAPALRRRRPDCRRPSALAAPQAGRDRRGAPVPAPGARRRAQAGRAVRRLLVLYGLAMASVVLLAFLVPLGLLGRQLAHDRALDAGRADAQQVAVFAGDTAQQARLEAAVLAVNEDGSRQTTVFLPDGTVFGVPTARSTAVELALLGTAVTARTAGGVELLLPVAGPEGKAAVRTFVPDAELTAGVQQTWLVLVGVGHERPDRCLALGARHREQQLNPAAVELVLLGTAVTARTGGGVELLLPVAGPEGKAAVRTFVPDAELTAGVRQTWLVLVGVGALLLGATVLAGDRIARRLARSALDLSHVADRLGAGDLTARVTPSGPPEIVSVGRVLNGLGARVAGLLAAERELVADLSHRLRTPITALRLDVDLLEDPLERERMAAHVDDLVQAVDDVVWIARNPGSQAPELGCDAAAVVAGRARFWAVLAADQGRDLDIDLPDAALAVPASAAALGAAVDVLVDNVFSHTPDRTPFAVAVRARGDVVEVVVQDAGPGFATTALAERGRSGAGSTGLGLDVARRTVEDVGGRLVLDTAAGGGARIVLELPRA